MQTRNAASVLPEPVGAEINASRPSRMAGQPWSCGSVGFPNRVSNHSAPRGSKWDSTCLYCTAGLDNGKFAMIPLADLKTSLGFAAVCRRRELLADLS